MKWSNMAAKSKHNFQGMECSASKGHVRPRASVVVHVASRCVPGQPIEPKDVCLMAGQRSPYDVGSAADLLASDTNVSTSSCLNFTLLQETNWVLLRALKETPNFLLTTSPTDHLKRKKKQVPPSWHNFYRSWKLAKKKIWNRFRTIYLCTTENMTWLPPTENVAFSTSQLTSLAIKQQKSKRNNAR